MRSAPWLLVVVAIGAIARAEPATGTVIVSCNEADAALIVDGVLLPERTPAVLTLAVGPHVIEARKSPLVPDKKVVEVNDQQPVKVRFELLPANLPPPPPPATGSDAGSAAGSGSAAGPGSAAGSGSGPASPPTAGSGAGSGSSPTPTVLPASAPAAKASRCTEGGREVACIQGPHCTEGGRPVPCKKGESLPPELQPPPPPPTGPSTVVAATTGAGAGSAAHVEPPRTTPGGPGVEIATTVPHAIAYVDGAPVHDAPCLLQLEPGEHVVAVVAAGMMPAETLLKVEPTKHLRVELNPSTPRKRIDVPAQ